MTLSENIITVLIILLLAILGYCGITHKSLTEFYRELKEMFSPTEVIELTGGIK